MKVTLAVNKLRALCKTCDGEEVYSIDDNDDDVELEGDNGTTELIENRE